MSALDRLRTGLATSERKAAEFREKLAAEEEQAASEREARARTFDERFVAEFDRERLDADIRKAYDDVVAAVREWPLTQALVRQHAAAVRRQVLYSELNGARTRLGLPLVHEPVVRDVPKLVTFLEQIVSEEAGLIVREELEALHAERFAEE